MRKATQVHALLDKMQSAEADFLQTEFLAPLLPGRRVQVRIAGLVCTLQVEGAADQGWAILRPLSLDTARVIGRAELGQVRAYLELFPAVRLIALLHTPQHWLAVPARRGDARLQVASPLPLQLAIAVQPFQQVVARFDGVHFWFQEIDRRRNPAVAAYLRQAMAAEMPPDHLHKPTLTAEEREAYRRLYQAIEDARRDQVEVRLSDALAHAGGALTSYLEREDAYTIAFNVDGQAYHSTVRKDDLTVLVAGICLAGQDGRFDLQSLVGVIREGAQQRRIVRVGEHAGLDEDDYWEIHPPDGSLDE